MHGLVLAKEYYQEYGLPLLSKKFAAQHERIAAGLVGDGSDCLGFDDKYSTDHDWGPGFCWWLSKEDYGQFERPAGGVRQGCPPASRASNARPANGATAVSACFEIDAFYKGFLGRNGSAGHTAGLAASAREELGRMHFRGSVCRSARRVLADPSATAGRLPRRCAAGEDCRPLHVIRAGGAVQLSSIHMGVANILPHSMPKQSSAPM